MRDRDDGDSSSVGQAVRDGVRESAKDVAMGSIAERPSLGSLDDKVDRLPNMRGESLTQTALSRLIPEDAVPEIDARRAVEVVLRAIPRHGGPATRLQSL